MGNINFLWIYANGLYICYLSFNDDFITFKLKYFDRCCHLLLLNVLFSVLSSDSKFLCKSSWRLSSKSILASLIVTLICRIICVSISSTQRSSMGTSSCLCEELSRLRASRSIDVNKGWITVRSNVSEVARSRFILSSAYFESNFAVRRSFCFRLEKQRSNRLRNSSESITTMSFEKQNNRTKILYHSTYHVVNLGQKVSPSFDCFFL